jgi:hypothetical protein
MHLNSKRKMEEEEYGDTTIQDNIDELGGHYTK